MPKSRNRIPAGIEHIVRGHCEDYRRRADAIKEGKLPPETLAHYTILNAKIDHALSACCESYFHEEMREDIAHSAGHDKSRLYHMSANTYKTYKLEIKLAIAKAFHLL